MEFIANAPRQLRSYLRRMVETDRGKNPTHPLLVVGPKVTGRAGWWYATVHNDCLFAITKRPVATRDAARGPEAMHRFGRKASEYRPAKAKAAA